jgi:hypothetical protein
VSSERNWLISSIENDIGLTLPPNVFAKRDDSRQILSKAVVVVALCGLIICCYFKGGKK